MGLRTASAAAVIALAIPCVCSADDPPPPPEVTERVLIGPGFEGFDWTFDDFVATVEPDSIRLMDLINGWGGAARVLSDEFEENDLSGFATGRLVLEVSQDAFNQTDTLTIELVDQDNDRGKWTLLVSGAEPGEARTVVARSPLASPEQTIGGPLDLDRLDRWQILGEFGSKSPLDVTIYHLRIDTEVPPPPPYQGSSPGAAWRSTAEAMLDQNRRAHTQVRVCDINNLPLWRAEVSIEMWRHGFEFGVAVDASSIPNPAPSHDNYRALILELFNRATIENNLKWPAWEGEWGPAYGRTNALATLDWLNNHGLPVRGHNLVWPGVTELPSRVAAVLTQESPLTPGDEQFLREQTLARIAEGAGATAGMVDLWDVVNEPRNDNDLMRALPEGDAVIADWLAAARQADPSALLAINENDVLASSGGVFTHRLDQLLALISQLQAAGAPLDAVGLQGHFNQGSLSGPEQLWAVLDAVAATGLRIDITEFDFETQDETLQADFTRDFLTAAFAHPAVRGITLWGFAEHYHWRPSAALYRSDWTPKPNGEVYRQLVLDTWRTNLEPQITHWSGWTPRSPVYSGSHHITAKLGKCVAQRSVTIPAGDDYNYLVTLPLLSGDFNLDASVDLQDLEVYNEQLGQSVEPATGADANGDGVVNSRDRIWWERGRQKFLARTAASPLPGDYDGDGKVNAFDLRFCKQIMGMAVRPGFYADGNGNGVVDYHDIHVWRAAVAGQ